MRKGLINDKRSSSAPVEGVDRVAAGKGRKQGHDGRSPEPPTTPPTAAEEGALA